jgi:hypothetical protein
LLIRRSLLEAEEYQEDEELKQPPMLPGLQNFESEDQTAAEAAQLYTGITPLHSRRVPALRLFAVARLCALAGSSHRADFNGCMGTVIGETDSSSQRWPGREDVMLLAAHLTIVAHADAVDDDDDAALQNGCAVRINQKAGTQWTHGYVRRLD